MRKAAIIRIRCDLAGAFSLLELLVVISITSLLLGILMPALNRCRSLAKQAICQSRLRQWGLAFEAYSSGNNGFYPHIDGLDRDASRADRFGWVDMLPPLMGEKKWRDYPRWHKPSIKTIFQCPTARLGNLDSYKYYPQKDGYFSYAMNSCLELDRNCWPSYHPYIDPTGGTNNMPSFLNTALIRNPSRVILLYDQLLDPRKGYGGEKYNGSAGQYCGSYPKAFAARHARKRKSLGGNILYCDYHVEWIRTVWKSEWPNDLEVPPRSDSEWFPY